MPKFSRFCYLGALMLYILAGVRLTPFHGDESTDLYMSSDFDSLFLRGDLAHLVYQDPPPSDDPQSATRQDLRILNGVVNKYIYGLAGWLTGFSAKDLNQQWLWGADFRFNQAQGTIPSEKLLFICRWGSTLLTVLSLAVMFAIGHRVGGWRAAALTALIYAMMPAVILNGRRAIFESGLLLFSALLIYLGQRATDKLRQTWLVIALGVVAGLVIASKHTGLIVVAVVCVGLIGCAVWRRSIPEIGRALLTVLIVLGIASGVFLALNVAWWSNPRIMPEKVLARRIQLSEGAASVGAYTDSTQRLTALVREAFSAPPQYFEDHEDWPHWIGDQITAYEASHLGGLSGTTWSIFLGALFVVGLARTLRNFGDGAAFLALTWLVATAFSLLVLTLLDWQRYYMPVMMPVTIVCGMAVMSPAYLAKRRVSN